MMERARTHVLFFAPTVGGGGAERHLVRVARHLDPARFRVSVAVCRGGGSYEGELGPNLAYHVLGTRRLLAAVGPLARLLRAERPDLVCSFLDPANCVALVAARLAGSTAALVVGVQNTVSVSLGRRRGIRHRAIRRAIPYLYRRADAVAALAQGVADDLLAQAPGLRGRVRVIPNAGYDDGALAAAAEPLAAAESVGRPLIVACGRLTPQKDYPTLLRALARVRRELPATLWIVGQGEQRGELEALADRLEVASAVRFMGFQANPYPFMRAADLFVLSSRWEGFGNVIVEAMAVGTPVVATDCNHGPREIIRHGESGLLAPPGDDAALATAMLRVLRDPALAARLAAGGAERARSFAAPAIAERYGELFQEVLAARAATRAPRAGAVLAGAGR
jgi:glycosyltransferase involved in cell wall biosynthesis